MNRIITCLVALVAITLLAPGAQAHPHATVIEVDGARCYLVTDGINPDVEFWIETNGILTGGEARGPPGPALGLPVYGLPFWDLGELVFNILGTEPGELLGEEWEDGSSGLQRGAGGDTEITQSDFEALCQ